MKRRDFLMLGLGAFALTSLPLKAVNFRETLPKLWDITKVEPAIKETFGSSKTLQEKIKLKAPDIAENGAVIPISFETDLKPTKIAIYQDANPESAVVVFSVPKNAVLDYALRLKLQKTGTITIVAEADGKLYSDSKLVKVTIGGCGG